ncbi:MAG: hypothetical protein EOR51_12080 [Mesorhizobium sp.]|uniref:hypothetical protein n=1 Tax=Mesorhizobium sp. TaxID=1871066 RepID=UPI000FE860FD|nr:hypothetical protein [Mesorhizobium sp.]RWK79641.1 MAG: hypothetical protein EOR50_05810 [Mesorhizobium sp.]RWK82417.1 MAG: hypothetical protein EOR51_12080 [Mesorhizobium sp.]RWL08764.1 MAG: hypothetical protein EOR55_03470 [Mesorhizobium sp.]
MTITAKGDTFEYEDGTALKKDAQLVVPMGGVAAGGTASGNPVPVGGDVATTLPTYSAGQRAVAQFSTSGRLMAAVGTALVGADGVGNTALIGIPVYNDTIANGRTLAVATNRFNGTSWDRDRKPNATSRIPSAAASTNGTSAKASAGDLHCISGYNAAATVRYLKFYAKATAPVVGTDTPVITLALQPTSAFNINMNGHYIATGIAYALTTGAADADTGALTAADVVGLTITYA